MGSAWCPTRLLQVSYKQVPRLVPDLTAKDLRCPGRGFCHSSVAHAATMTDDQGRIRVLVTAVGPGPASAVVDLGKTAKPLTSRYGGTVALGDGKYRFTGMDIASDILADAQ